MTPWLTSLPFFSLRSVVQLIVRAASRMSSTLLRKYVLSSCCIYTYHDIVPCQAVLSPFAQRKVDPVTAATLEDLNDDAEIPVGDDDEDDTEDRDEVALEVEASDEQTVDSISEEAELDGRLLPMSAADGAFATVAITKVCAHVHAL